MYNKFKRKMKGNVCMNISEIQNKILELKKKKKMFVFLPTAIRQERFAKLPILQATAIN